MTKSFDEEASDAAHQVLKMLPKNYWETLPEKAAARGDVLTTHTPEEFVNNWIISCKYSRDKARTEIHHLYKSINPSDSYEQLITLSFDKEKFEPRMILQLVNILRRKCPKPIDFDEAICRPEFNAQESSDPSFNPHLHIYTPKIKKASEVANALNKKFVSCKKPPFPIYNVNVVEAPAPSHKMYILGKKASKDKNIKLSNDEIFRNIHGIEEIYYISQK